MITLERAASSIQLGKGHPPNLFNYYDLTVLKLPVIHTDLLTLSTTPIQYKYTFVLSTGITYSGLFLAVSILVYFCIKKCMKFSMSKTFCKFSGFLDLDGTVSREGFQIQISPRYFTRGKRIVFMFSLIFEYKDDINLANFLCRELYSCFH